MTQREQERTTDPGPSPDQDQEKTVRDLDSDSDRDQDCRPQRPQRPHRAHRPLAQSASYQPGDTISRGSNPPPEPPGLRCNDRPRTRKGITHNPPPLSSAVARTYRSRWKLQDSDPEPSDDEGLRVVLIGDQAVGKSSLASVFAGTSDRDQEDSPDTFERTLTVDGEETTLTVMDTWDRRHNEACLLAGTAYVIVYSVADRSSFEAAAELRITLRRARQNERLPIIIVGNKSDLVRAREVTTQEGLACAVVFDCKFIETSASLNHNVLELFEGVVRQLRLHRGAGVNTLTLAPLTLTPRRKHSLTERARRLLDRIVSRGNHRVSLRARSKSCHDLAVL